MESYKKLVYDNYYSKRIDRDIPTDISSLLKFNPFYQSIISKHFPKNKNVKIVDLGCGYGGFVNAINTNGYKNVKGVDASYEMTNVADRLGIKGVTNGDLLKFVDLCDDKSIDVVILIDVIEHFKKQELFDLVSQLYKIIKDDGMVITHQPNAEGIFGNAIRYGDITHEQSFTRVSIAQIFLSNGFSEVKSYEDKPIPHTAISFVRRFLWTFFARPFYVFLLAIESGGSDKGIVLTKNFLSIIRK